MLQAFSILAISSSDLTSLIFSNNLSDSISSLGLYFTRIFWYFSYVTYFSSNPTFWLSAKKFRKSSWFKSLPFSVIISSSIVILELTSSIYLESVTKTFSFSLTSKYPSALSPVKYRILIGLLIINPSNPNACILVRNWEILKFI